MYFTNALVKYTKMELRKNCVLVIIIILNIIKWSQSTICTNTSFSSYFDTLLAEYDRDVAPAQLVSVGIGVYVRHVTLDEDGPTVRFLADIYTNWTDLRLAWTSDWGCDSTQLASQRIFCPEVRILSIGAMLGAATDPLPLHLTSEGNITKVIRVDLRLPVALNLRYWPNDVQTFKVVFGSPSLSSKELELIPVQREFSGVIETTGIWKLIAAVLSVSTVPYEDDKRYIATVTLSIMRIAPAHSLANGAVLSAVLCSLAAAVFLSPQSRAPLCTAAAFTASFWLISCLLRLSHPGTTPLSLSLMATVCVCAALMTVASAVILRVAKRSGAPPALVKRVVNASSEFCRLTPDEDTSSQAESGAWAATAKLLDRILCSTMLLCLFIIFSVYFLCLVT